MNARIKTTKRMFEAEDLFTARPSQSTILDPDELVTEIQIPAPQQATEQTYQKFRIRQSIDFPIIGVACSLTMDSGKISDARIVLGAVAPVPLRARETEDFLKGKKLTPEVAAAAASVAVKGALPLARNGFKIQITRAMVKRAILSTIR